MDNEQFPGFNPEFGGIVVGDAYRVDQDKVADRRFYPENPKRLGQGEKAPLLIDPCQVGPTHSLIVIGSGRHKTTTAIPTLPARSPQCFTRHASAWSTRSMKSTPQPISA